MLHEEEPAYSEEGLQAVVNSINRVIKVATDLQNKLTQDSAARYSLVIANLKNLGLAVSNQDIASVIKLLIEIQTLLYVDSFQSTPGLPVKETPIELKLIKDSFDHNMEILCQHVLLCFPKLSEFGFKTFNISKQSDISGSHQN